MLAHDWPSAQRTLAAIRTPLLLVRGDVNAAFPKRNITPPEALEKALHEDPDMRLVHRAGKLELFALRERISPAGSITSYATVNSAMPDLRDLALLHSGTALISSTMRPGFPQCFRSRAVSQWRLVGNKLKTFVAEPPGRRYQIKLLSATGAFKRPEASFSRQRDPRSSTSPAIQQRARAPPPVSGRRSVRPGSSPISAIMTAMWSKNSATSWAVPC